MLVTAQKKIPELKESERQAEIARKNKILSDAKVRMVGNVIGSYKNAVHLLETIPGWKDADELLECARQRLKELEAEELERKRQKEKKAEEERLQRKHQLDQEHWKRHYFCQHCGGSFKGLIKKTCISCGKPKDY